MMIDLPVELSLFWDIGLVIAVATLLAYFARLLRQPVILAYVIAGILIGPGALRLITNADVIRTLSEFGIAFLLFIVGLELDLRKLRNVGFSAVVIAILKSIILFALGFLISQSFGFQGYTPVYLGLTLAFSSTMIVVKLLSDKNELNTLHGRIIVAILLAEDVLAIMVLSLLSTPGEFSTSLLAESLSRGVLLLSIALLTSRLILPGILSFVSKSQELLFLTALSVCFVFSGMAQVLGFSIAIGSFLGGLAFASSPYNIEIISRVQSLKEFFSTIFFVSLGMGVGISFSYELVLPLVVFILMVVVVKSLVIMIMSSVSGYSVRTSFLTALSLTQISEFSLIIVIQGLKMGHISQDVFSITVFLGLITITITSYLIKFDEFIYRFMSKYLVAFEGLSRLNKRVFYDSETPRIAGHRKHVIVCGCNRMGYSIVKALSKMDMDVLVIEFDPDIIDHLRREGINSMYGDIGDIEVLRRANIADAQMVISTIPRLDDNLLLIKEAKKINPRILVIVTASNLEHAVELYENGADYVVLPKWLAGEKAADFISVYVENPHNIEHIRREHLRNIVQIMDEDFFERYQSGLLRRIGRKLKRDYEEE
ncbi:MAG: cation:proton antiporter [Candidatus Altiarchaeota archaeon]